MYVILQLHVPSALPKGKTPGTHYIGGLVKPRADVDSLEEMNIFTLPGIEPRPSIP
jgi:hypothetical protein